MLAAVINAILVLAGSSLGLLLKGKISERLMQSILSGLGLCVLVIGISGATKTQNILCVIICMVIGILIGEALRIEDRLDSLGGLIKDKLKFGSDSGNFTQGFMTATLLYCVGSMAITGSMEAGLNNDFSIIISKSVLDAVASVSLAAALGIGVCFSALSVLVYQGLLTLLFIFVGFFIPVDAVNEMSAIGGVIIIAIGLNMFVLPTNKIRCGNMLPAIFLPIAYIPIADFIISLFS